MQAFATKVTRHSCVATSQPFKASKHHCAPAAWTQDYPSVHIGASETRIIRPRIIITPTNYSPPSNWSPTTKSHNASAATRDEASGSATRDEASGSVSSQTLTSRSSLFGHWGKFLGSVKSVIETHITLQAADPLDVRESTRGYNTIPVGLDGPAAAAVYGAFTNLPAATPTKCAIADRGHLCRFG